MALIISADPQSSELGRWGGPSWHGFRVRVLPVLAETGAGENATRGGSAEKLAGRGAGEAGGGKRADSCGGDCKGGEFEEWELVPVLVILRSSGRKRSCCFRTSLVKMSSMRCIGYGVGKIKLPRLGVTYDTSTKEVFQPKILHVLLCFQSLELLDLTFWFKNDPRYPITKPEKEISIGAPFNRHEKRFDRYKTVDNDIISSPGIEAQCSFPPSKSSGVGCPVPIQSSSCGMSSTTGKSDAIYMPYSTVCSHFSSSTIISCQ